MINWFKKHNISGITLGLILAVIVLSGMLGYNTVKAQFTYNQNSITYPASNISLDSNGAVTYDELVKDVQSDVTYSKLDFSGWNTLITQHGINHIDDNLLQTTLNNIPPAITQDLTQLQGLVLPDAITISSINSQVASLQNQRDSLQATLNSIRANAVSTSDQKQQAANNVATVDGQIDLVSKPLQISGQILELNRHIQIEREKFACGIEEQQLRASKQVTRTYIHSTYYLDFNAHSGLLSGTVTFTNGSATVTGSGTAFSTEIANNDYVRVSNGTEWYKVTARASATSMTITPAFQQTTVTDGAGATYLSASATQDGTTTTKAFCHLNRYTTDTTRTAGDILKVRANQTNVIAGINITFDEVGTVTSYIEIRGCSSSDDPFSDNSNVQPIFDFGNTAFGLNASKTYWRIYNLTITNNNLSSQGLVHSTANGVILDTLTVFLNNNANGVGVSFYNDLYILNSTIYSNKKYNINTNSTNGMLTISNCAISGGAAGTSYGIYGNAAGVIANVNDTTFGVGTTHSTADIYFIDGNILFRNCNFASTVFVSSSNRASEIISEDHNQTLGAHYASYYSGTVQKCAAGLTDTTVRAGGGSSSALMLPSSNCTIKYPLNIAYGSLNPDFAIWGTASTAMTVTVYIRANAAWSPYPTASQLFIQADYYDTIGSAHRGQSTASTQTLSDDSTWVAFTTTFTPAVTGWAYIKVNLGLYQSGKGIYVDVLPVTS